MRVAWIRDSCIFPEWATIEMNTCEHHVDHTRVSPVDGVFVRNAVGTSESPGGNSTKDLYIAASGPPKLPSSKTTLQPNFPDFSGGSKILIALFGP